ncbi:MAG: glutaredoxin family protein, partial [Candidatus Odinarchaeia archaeon]
MSQKIEFTHEPGEKKSCVVKVYALSTCGFCRRALEYLRNHSVNFHYVYVDKLPHDAQDELIAELEEKHNTTVGFPFLVLDDKKCYVGFNFDKYQKILDTIMATETLKEAVDITTV